MADKIVSLGDVRKKLYYIFRSYDIPKCVRNDVFGALKKIPEAKTVRHGQWIQSDVFKCSECGYSFEHEGYLPFFNYCPNCGAEMGGGDYNDS